MVLFKNFMFNFTFIVACNMPQNVIVIHRNECVTNANNNKIIIIIPVESKSWSGAVKHFVMEYAYL